MPIKTPVTHDCDGRWFEADGRHIKDNEVSALLNSRQALVDALTAIRKLKIDCTSPGVYFWAVQYACKDALAEASA